MGCRTSAFRIFGFLCCTLLWYSSLAAGFINRAKVDRNSLAMGWTDNSLQVYSLSLNYTESSGSSVHFSKTVRDIWRWKDSVLGDGRDFFVPKPRTLSALQSALQAPTITECIVLSNCARFEVLVVTSDPQPTDTISRLLVHQMKVYENRKGWLIPGDWPDLIAQPPKVLPACDRSSELARYWEVRQGTETVMWHWMQVAAGMALRPRRPNRPVEFRPFSSRDAHILLQLKRTVEIHNKASTVSSSILSVILNSALSAGKAARNPDKVPELNQLKPFGSGNSKYDPSLVPGDVMEKVLERVRHDALEPALVRGMAKLQAQTQSDLIADFRRQALARGQTPEQVAEIRRKLHEPTMEIREGKHVCIDEFLSTLIVEVENS